MKAQEGFFFNRFLITVVCITIGFNILLLTGCVDSQFQSTPVPTDPTIVELENAGLKFVMDDSSFNKTDNPPPGCDQFLAAYKAFPYYYREIFKTFNIGIKPIKASLWADDKRAAAYNGDLSNCVISYNENAGISKNSCLHEMGHHFRYVIEDLKSPASYSERYLRDLAYMREHVEVMLSAYPKETVVKPPEGTPGCLRPYTCTSREEVFADGLAYYRLRNGLFREKMENDLANGDSRLSEWYAFFNLLYSTPGSWGTHASSVSPVNYHGHLQRGLHAEYKIFDRKLNSISDGKNMIPANSLLVPHLNWPDSERGIAGIPICDRIVVRFSGGLIVEKGGTYKFQLESDDGSVLYIDGIKEIDNDNIHPMRARDSREIVLSAGCHAIRVDYFDDSGNAGLILRYRPPGGQMQPVPSRLFIPAPNSIMEEYFKTDTELLIVPIQYLRPPDYFFVETAVNVNGGGVLGFPKTQDSFRKGPGLYTLKDRFAAAFSGTLFVPSTKEVKFSLSSDDGSRFYLDGKSVIINDGVHSMRRKRSKNVFLTKGPHDFVIKYFEAKGEAGLGLKMDKKSIPLSRLAPVRMGLKAECFNISPGTVVLPDFSRLKRKYFTNVACLDFPLLKTPGAPWRTSRKNFAMRFSGSFLVDEPGNYTFYLDSDDGSKLYLDGIPLIDNNGTHGMRKRDSGSIFLFTGPHDLEVLYFQAGGSGGIRMLYKRDGQGESVVPATMLSPFRGGVTAEFFDLPNRDFSSIDNSDIQNRLSSAPSLVRRFSQMSIPEMDNRDLMDRLSWGGSTPAKFAARLSGMLYVRSSGDYTIGFACDDGGRLLIDGDLVIDHDGTHSLTERQIENFVLEAGFHRVVVEYFDNGGRTGVSLSWVIPGNDHRWEIIPSECFFNSPPWSFGPTRQY